MPDLIQDLYESRVYPAMSHPLSDPAVSAVAAMLGGLEVNHPANSRILEIGCGSGLNLIPLAIRWPNSRFVGMDRSAPSIQVARELASAAGVGNIEFHAADLRDFRSPNVGYHFIIAHGFFSWVPDEVKAALFAFCQQQLAPEGVVTISFNLECGWVPRMPVIAKVRAIQLAGAGDEMAALAILRSITDEDSAELAIIDDMMAKGPEILPFDDFSPVNDPWPMDRFVRAATESGLRWLGESDPGENLPPGLDEATLDRLRLEAKDPLAFQIAADVAAGRTFRSGVLCRNDARVPNRISLDLVFQLAVRAGFLPSTLEDQAVFQTIAAHAPACISVEDLHAALPSYTGQDLARLVHSGIHSGWIRPRIEPVIFDAEVPVRPCLDPFRLECARRHLPLVDVWHTPCSFPVRHYDVLAAMDGTRDLAALVGFSSDQCPELDFDPWIRHLAGRGMFT